MKQSEIPSNSHVTHHNRIVQVFTLSKKSDFRLVAQKSHARIFIHMMMNKLCVKTPSHFCQHTFSSVWHMESFHNL